MMKKTLLQQQFLQRLTRFILLPRDSFAYSACKLKIILYKITGKRQSPYIKNFSKELLGQSSLLIKLVKESLRRRRITKYFVYTLLKVLENNYISQAFFRQPSTRIDKSGEFRFPPTKDQHCLSCPFLDVLRWVHDYRNKQNRDISTQKHVSYFTHFVYTSLTGM